MEDYKQKSIPCPNCGTLMMPGGICPNPNCNYPDPAEGGNHDEQD